MSLINNIYNLIVFWLYLTNLLSMAIMWLFSDCDMTVFPVWVMPTIIILANTDFNMTIPYHDSCFWLSDYSATILDYIITVLDF